MPLPVLKQVSAPLGPPDWLRLFHAAQLRWGGALGDEVALDVGTWLHNRALQPLPTANAVHDARLVPGVSPADAVAEVDASAAAVGSPCRAWTINPSAAAADTQPLVDHLLAMGWAPAAQTVLRLNRFRSPPAAAPIGMTVIPARAALRAYAELAAGRHPAQPAAAEAASLHLDDAHFDALLVLRDRQPIASVGVLGTGDVGTLRHLYVAPAHRNRGVGSELLRRAIEICLRSGYRHVMVGWSGDANFFERSGFEPIGTWTRYVRR